MEATGEGEGVWVSLAQLVGEGVASEEVLGLEEAEGVRVGAGEGVPLPLALAEGVVVLDREAVMLAEGVALLPGEEEAALLPEPKDVTLAVVLALGVLEGDSEGEALTELQPEAVSEGLLVDEGVSVPVLLLDSVPVSVGLTETVED